MDDYQTKPTRLNEHRQDVEEAAAAGREKKSPGPAEPPEQVLDAAAVLKRFGGNVQFLQEVIQLFQEECPRLLGELRDAVARGDAEKIQHVAHTLKGAVGNFKAPQAVEAARKLEDLGRAKDLAGVEEAFRTLENEIERLKEALRQLGAPAAPSGKEPS